MLSQLLVTPEFTFEESRFLTRDAFVQDSRFLNFKDSYLNACRELPAEVVQETVEPVLVSSTLSPDLFDSMYLKALSSVAHPNVQIIQFEYLRGLLHLFAEQSNPLDLGQFYETQLLYSVDDALLLLLYSWFDSQGMIAAPVDDDLDDEEDYEVSD